MSKLNIDQKSVRALFSEKKADFLIPDYQRPYAWGEKECQTLWDDLFLFAFPDNDCDKFNSDSDEYFLGPIVTFKNDDGKMEIIDGQQRLTTLMLLLRAFYEKYGSMKNDKAVKTSKFIEQCIWKTDEFGDPDKSALKIDSEVATDKEKDEFLNILKTGTLSDCEKSSYLLKLLPPDEVSPLDLEGKLQLEYYKLQKTFAGAIELEHAKGVYEPVTQKGALGHDPKEPLDEIILKINEKFKGEFTNADRVLLTALHDRLLADPKLAKLARSSDPQIFTESIFPKAFDTAAQDSYLEAQDTFASLFEDTSKYKAIMSALAEWLYGEFRKK